MCRSRSSTFKKTTNRLLPARDSGPRDEVVALHAGGHESVVGGERRALVPLFRRVVQLLERALKGERLLVELRLAQDVPSRLAGQGFQVAAAAGKRCPVARHQCGQQLL